MEKDVFYPRNFVETPAEEPKPEDRKAIIDAARVAVRAMIGSIAATRPVEYAKIIEKIVASFPLRVYEAEALIIELDREWHPEKFEAKEVGVEEGVIK